MKFACICGQTIVDQTDYLFYKAYAIPDQDLSDLYDELGNLIEQAVLLGASESDTTAVGQSLAGIQRQMAAAMVRHRKKLYQCPECGRLYIKEVETGLYCAFVPEDCPNQKSILRSVHGDEWKRLLRGWWDADLERGKLKGKGVVEEEPERFGTWDALQARYFEVFERLRDDGLLRSASLRKGGRVVHKWPSD